MFNKLQWYVNMETLDSKEVQICLKDVLRSVTMRPGEQCVMISGTTLMLVLHAHNWDILQIVSQLM